MNWLISVLKKPHLVWIATFIIMLSGVFVVFQLPITLFPNINYPTLKITTEWRASSAAEVESELLQPQEEALEGLVNVRTIKSRAVSSMSTIDIEFKFGTNMDNALVEVFRRLERIQHFPIDAKPPQITTISENLTLSYLLIRLEKPSGKAVDEYKRMIEKRVVPLVEKIEGVSTTKLFVGTRKELQVIVDPQKIIHHNVDIDEIVDFLQTTSSTSAGHYDIGRRRFAIRVSGLNELEQLRKSPIKTLHGTTIQLEEITTISIERSKSNEMIIHNGYPAIGFQVFHQEDANILASLEQLEQVIKQLNTQVLSHHGMVIEQSFDASVFVRQALNLVTGSLLLGVILAGLILYFFMRNRRLTLLVVLTIPISLITTIIFIYFAGRTINIITIAGFALASGLILDAAIIVAENIMKQRQSGKTLLEACHIGVHKVSRALIASTITSVVIFFPIILIEDASGQLFADLALTIAVSIFVSLLVSIFLLPTLIYRFTDNSCQSDPFKHYWEQIAQSVMKITNKPIHRLFVLLVLLVLPVILILKFPLQMDYLPVVKRDAIDTYFSLPSSAHFNYMKKEVIEPIKNRITPYYEGESQPKVKNYYIAATHEYIAVGVRAEDRSQLTALQTLIEKEVAEGFLDFSAYTFRGSLFGSLDSGRKVPLIVFHDDNEVRTQVANQLITLIEEHFNGVSISTQPHLAPGAHEVTLTPKMQQVVESGVTLKQIHSWVSMSGDGIFSGRYFDGEERMNIIVRFTNSNNIEQMLTMLINTPNSGLRTMHELLEVNVSVSPSEYIHVDGQRAIVLNIRPPEGLGMDTIIQDINKVLLPKLQQPQDQPAFIRFGDSADDISKAFVQFSLLFVIALFILLLILFSVLRSFKDSLLVVLTLPLSAIGGFFALHLLNVITGQLFDFLALIGFVILLGLVVNNAIILMTEIRTQEATGCDRFSAIQSALTLRLRPIVVSTLTSLLGMLPLLLMPGAGGEIYKALAAVIVGGMTFSFFFMVILLPTFLRMSTREKASEKQQILIQGNSYE